MVGFKGEKRRVFPHPERRDNELNNRLFTTTYAIKINEKRLWLTSWLTFENIIFSHSK